MAVCHSAGLDGLDSMSDSPSSLPPSPHMGPAFLRDPLEACLKGSNRKNGPKNGPLKNPFMVPLKCSLFTGKTDPKNGSLKMPLWSL